MLRKAGLQIRSDMERSDPDPTSCNKPEPDPTQVYLLVGWIKFPSMGFDGPPSPSLGVKM